jgi:Big-like domain-containing protein/putative Ig domain-containing protein/beta-propeller repeat-containing protein
MRCKWLIVVAVLVLVALSRPRIVPSTQCSLELTRLQAIQQMKAMPIAFEANVGQTDPAASFVARGSGYAMWATGDGPVLRLTRSDTSQHRAATVRLRVVGGEMAERPSAEKLLPGRSNYFIGNDPSGWKTGVRRYGALRYEGVYPGVDLVLHGTQEQLEYDFDVAPGMDPSQIAVAFEGAQVLRVEPNGDLTLTVAGGELAFRPPVAYQEKNGAREFVAARYELAENNVMTFALGEYDRSLPLVIDPVVSYSTYLGGQHNSFGGVTPSEKAFAIAVDGSGNAYLTGYTEAIDFPLAGAFDSTCAGCFNSGVDAFVTKIDPSQSGAASLVFSTYLGAMGNGSTFGTGIAVDSASNVYVTGWTSGYDIAGTPANEAFPTTASAVQQNDGGDLAGSDAFLTKFNPQGSMLLYSTYLGGNNGDEGKAVKADDFGNAVVVGRSASSNFPELKNGYQMTNKGVFDAFVVKIDTTQSGAASLKYGTLLGGGTNESAGSVTLDLSGRIYVAGDTQSTKSNPPFPTLNGFQTVGGGGDDGFMAKIDPSAIGANSLLYSTFIGGDGSEGASVQEGGIAVDANGIVYVTGSTFGAFSVPFPTTPGAYKTTPQGNVDAYVVKIDPVFSGAQSLLASTLLGGQFADSGRGIAIDQVGNPVVVGSTISSDFGFSSCVPALSGNQDAFAAVLDPSLATVKFATHVGGSLGSDWAYGVGIGPQNQIYLAGETQATNFPTTANAYDQSANGGSDAFLTIVASPSCPAAPVVSGFSTSTAEDTPALLTLNATDANGNDAPPDNLTWTMMTAPSHGGLDVTSGSMTHGSGSAYSTSVTYTPVANYSGPDSFQFRVNDGTTNSSTVTVTITVTAVNDSPVPGADSATTQEDTSVTVNVLSNDTDVEGNALSVTLPVSCDNGAGIVINPNKTVTVTPAANFNGTVSCSYTVDDGNGGTATGTLAVTVTPVNDNPVANADSATTSEDQPVTVNVLANDTDVDGDTLTVSLPSCNNNATVSVNADKTLLVSPAGNFNGTIACSYKVDDGHGGSATGQVTVNVTAVNDDPIANADSATTAEDMPVTVNVLSNDTDIDGDTLSVTSASCNNGAGIGINPNKTVTVSPAANFNGTITCGYAVNDGHGGSANGQLTVSVTPVNDNPIAAPDQASTDDNTSIVINVLGNDTDVDLDSLNLVSTGLCTFGKLTANPDGTVNYAPKPGFNGTDTCSYTVGDNNGGSASGQVTITVSKVNDPPVLTDPADQQTDAGTLVSLQLNASDADNDALTFSATGLPTGLNIDPLTGLISGTPDAGSIGSHLVTVTVSDGFSGSDTSTFDWVITSLGASDNHPPACSAAQPSVMSLWPADHRLVPIQINGVTDPDGGLPGIMITKILQDEPTNTAGDGTTWIDGFGIGTATAQIRAERTGSPKLPGDGRVYQIYFTATDDHGASCTGSVLVSVPHDGSGVNAVDSLIRYDSTVAGGQPVNLP